MCSQHGHRVSYSHRSSISIVVTAVQHSHTVIISTAPQALVPRFSGFLVGFGLVLVWALVPNSAPI